MNDVIKPTDWSRAVIHAALPSVTVEVDGPKVSIRSNLRDPWQTMKILMMGLDVACREEDKNRQGAASATKEPSRIFVPTLVMPKKVP